MLAAYATANWTAAALAGKMKPFSHYYNEQRTEGQAEGQALTRAEMDELDRIYRAEGSSE